MTSQNIRTTNKQSMKKIEKTVIWKMKMIIVPTLAIYFFSIALSFTRTIFLKLSFTRTEAWKSGEKIRIKYCRNKMKMKLSKWLMIIGQIIHLKLYSIKAMPMSNLWECWSYSAFDFKDTGQHNGGPGHIFFQKKYM